MTPIECKVRPIPEEEVFAASRPSRGIFSLRSGLGPWPMGLNLDSEIIFDMREDHRVMNIEIFAKVGGSLLSARKARQIEGGAFHCLSLTSPEGSLSAEEVGLNLQHKGADWIGWTFGVPEAPTRVWLGGGSYADVERDALVGLGIVFRS